MSGRENAGDDWRVGDLAECIWPEWYRLNGKLFPAGSCPAKGRSYIVFSVDVIPHLQVGEPPVPSLTFPNFGNTRWDAAGFRKIISDREEPMRLAQVPEPVA